MYYTCAHYLSLCVYVIHRYYLFIYGMYVSVCVCMYVCMYVCTIQYIYICKH